MSLRNEIETAIYTMLDDADPSGSNTERMKTFLSEMNDKQFYTYFDRFYADQNMNYNVTYQLCDNPVTVEFVEKLCDKYKIPLYEYVYKPFLNGDTKDPPRTVHKILVIDIPNKRLKQMIMSKNHMSVNPTKVDAKTGQMTGHDRVGRVTTPELYSLIVQNQLNVAKEEYGPLADDPRAANEMIRLIQRDGEVSLKDLPDDPLDKVAMTTIAYYMLGAGLITNMLDESGYVLPITARGDEEDSSAIQR